MTDVEMIAAPERWPIWPILPLKHRVRNFGSPNFLGFLIDELTTPPPYKVYIGMIYELDKLDALASEEYSTVEALCADWRVD